MENTDILSAIVTLIYTGCTLYLAALVWIQNGRIADLEDRLGINETKDATLAKQVHRAATDDGMVLKPGLRSVPPTRPAPPGVYP